MADAFREALKEQAADIARTVLDRMYDNPFWMERYGARGRTHADQDSASHLRYLDEALANDDPAVFEKYAVWLRSILVSRGMCSEHLAENFRLIAVQLDSRQLPSPQPALVVLERGVRALVYRTGAAAALEARRFELLRVVEGAPDAGGMRDDDRRYLVSYLIDAVATGTAAPFEAFAARCPPGTVAALRALITRPPDRFG